MTFVEVLLMMFSAMIVENFIFSKFYGICPFLGVSEKPDTALGMGMAVTFVITVSSAVTWGVYYLLLEPFDLEYLKTVAFILDTSCTSQHPIYGAKSCTGTCT